MAFTFLYDFLETPCFARHSSRAISSSSRDSPPVLYASAVAESTLQRPVGLRSHILLALIRRASEVMFTLDQLKSAYIACMGMMGYSVYICTFVDINKYTPGFLYINVNQSNSLTGRCCDPFIVIIIRSFAFRHLIFRRRLRNALGFLWRFGSLRRHFLGLVSWSHCSGLLWHLSFKVLNPIQRSFQQSFHPWGFSWSCWGWGHWVYWGNRWGLHGNQILKVSYLLHQLEVLLLFSCDFSILDLDLDRASVLLTWHAYIYIYAMVFMTTGCEKIYYVNHIYIYIHGLCVLGTCGRIASGFGGVAALWTWAGVSCGAATGVPEALLATSLGLPPISSENDGQFMQPCMIQTYI